LHTDCLYHQIAEGERDSEVPRLITLVGTQENIDKAKAAIKECLDRQAGKSTAR
jgi:hypothetical protein